MAYSRQTGPGVPGSFPLPNAGNLGNAYKANAIHPSAALGRALTGGKPAPVLGGKR